MKKIIIILSLIFLSNISIIYSETFQEIRDNFHKKMKVKPVIKKEVTIKEQFEIEETSEIIVEKEEISIEKPVKKKLKYVIGIFYGKYKPKGDMDYSDLLESNSIAGLNLKYLFTTNLSLRVGGAKWEQIYNDIVFVSNGITINGTASLILEPYSFNLLYHFPSNSKIKPYIGGGIVKMYSEARYTDINIQIVQKKTDSGYNAIIGSEYMLTERLALFIETQLLNCKSTFAIDNYSEELEVIFDDTFFVFGLNFLF